MRASRVIAGIVLGLAVSACQPGPLQLTKELKREAGQSRIVLMPADIELSELTAGGTLDPKAEWTDAAKRNLTDALRAQEAARHLSLIDYDEERVPAERRDGLHQASKLYRLVGQSIFIHQFQGPLQLPTKQNSFEWSLGPSVGVLREQYGADYALLTYVRDSYSSAGRVALQIVGAIAGIGIPGGSRLGFISLIYLQTGDIVWYNRIIGGTSDLRQPDGAKAAAAALLQSFPQ
jgi:hypothetical protein